MHGYDTRDVFDRMDVSRSLLANWAPSMKGDVIFMVVISIDSNDTL